MSRRKSSVLQDRLKGEICCPYCKGARMLVFEGTDGEVSIKCSNCGKFFTANLRTMSARKGSAIERKNLLCKR